MPFMDATTVHPTLTGCVKHQIEAGKDTTYRREKQLWHLLAKGRVVVRSQV
jgi:hypothetical protein